MKRNSEMKSTSHRGENRKLTKKTAARERLPEKVMRC